MYFELISKQTVTLTFAPGDFPLNQTQATLSELSVLVTTRAGASAAGLTVTVTAPGAASAASATTDANGLVTSSAAVPGPLGTQLGRPVIGDWTLGLSGPDPAGLSSVANVTLLLGYSYTPRSAT